MSCILTSENFLRTFFEMNVKKDLEEVEINFENYSEEFIKAFKKAETTYKTTFFHMVPASEDEINDIKNEVFQACITKISYQSDGFTGVSDKKHKNWLNAKKDSIKWTQRDYFYKYLEQKFSPKTIKAIDNLSDIVIDHLEDPKREAPISIKGLIMGEAQSGKTNLFTAICHKAIDAGWKFIIILSGMTNDLRIQTQKRMCKDLIGLSLDPESVTQKCGIGSFINDYDTKAADFIDLTRVDSDFSKDSTTKNLKKLSENNEEKRPFVHIAIIKKNSTILSNLLEWLGQSDPLKNQDRKNIAKDLPCLIIDDEADQASPNGSEEKGEISKINGQIRELIQVFNKSAYLAVTATPYANIFINPQLDLENGDGRLPDLFPSNFIFIKDRPVGYTGIEELFGPGNEDNYNELNEQVVVTIPENYDEVFEQPVKKGDKISCIPPSLKKAIRYFLCSCAYKDLTFNSHSTMMVHVDYRTGNQNDLAELIKDFLENEVNFIKNYQGDSQCVIENNLIYREYKQIWENGCQNSSSKKQAPTFKTLSGNDFYKVWHEKLYKAVKEIFIKTVNSDGDGQSLVSLYENNKNVRMIAVGGYALSRGVTLEGLCVTYLSRKAGTIDTLVQMGRFFGYREDCLSYMKIWTTNLITKLFEDACQAQAEFVAQVNAMNKADMTPEEFGYRIHKSPEYLKLRIAAKNKMFHSAVVTLDVEVAGHAFQSSKLPADIKEIEENRKLVSDFLLGLGEYEHNAPWDDYYWNDITSDAVAKLISEFSALSWGDVNKGIITNYIKDNMQNKKWQVRLISKTRNKTEEFIKENMFGLDLNGKKIGYSDSKVFEKEINGKKFLSFNKGSIMSGTDLGRYLKQQNDIDLSEDIDDALKAIQDINDKINKTKNKKSNCISANAILRYNWEKAPAQLLIYSISPKFTEEGQQELKEVYKNGLCALVVGIPAVQDDIRSSQKCDFYVNEVSLLNALDWS